MMGGENNEALFYHGSTKAKLHVSNYKGFSATYMFTNCIRTMQGDDMTEVAYSNKKWWVIDKKGHCWIFYI